MKAGSKRTSSVASEESPAGGIQLREGPSAQHDGDEKQCGKTSWPGDDDERDDDAGTIPHRPHSLSDWSHKPQTSGSLPSLFTGGGWWG